MSAYEGDNHDSNALEAAQEIQTWCGILLKTVRRDLEARLEVDGMGTLPFGILRVLQYEQLTLAEVSRRMHLAPASLVGAVDVLELRGLLTRGIDPRDRRRTPLALTDAGRSLLNRIPSASEQDMLVQALSALGSEQTAQLTTLLRSLVTHLPDGSAIVAGVSKHQGRYQTNAKLEKGEQQ